MTLSLLNCPNEILITICSFLSSMSDYICLSRTCKRIKNINTIIYDAMKIKFRRRVTSTSNINHMLILVDI